MKAKEKKPITVVERRLQSGAIFGTSSKPIPLAEPERWTVRLVNSQISDSRLYEMQAEKGWVFAEASDLAIKAEDIGLRIMDGRIVRGERGSEVLMKMERADYKAIQKAKDADNRKNTFGSKANKAAVLAAASNEPDGDRGADFLNRAVKSMNITDHRETVALDE